MNIYFLSDEQRPNIPSLVLSVSNSLYLLTLVLMQKLPRVNLLKVIDDRYSV